MIVKTWHQESCNEGWYVEREGCDFCECEDYYEAEHYEVDDKKPTPTKWGKEMYVTWSYVECICDSCYNELFEMKTELWEVL